MLDAPLAHPLSHPPLGAVTVGFYQVVQDGVISQPFSVICLMFVVMMMLRLIRLIW